MSAHYNRVMLRQLRGPLLELLGKLSKACAQVAQGESLPADLSGSADAQQLADSLKMAGCEALGHLSRTLAEAIRGLENGPARGWTEERGRAIATAAQRLADGIVPLIQAFAEGDGPLPVTLWPTWSALLTEMNESVPPPSALFEPAAAFDDATFERLDPAYLKEVVAGASLRLNQATERLTAAESAGDATAFTQALGQVQEVFDWAFRTRHRRSFQAYWLIVRARLAAARVHANQSLSDSSSIRHLLRNAHLELERFGADAARVSQQRQAEDIQPLLSPWDATMEHNEVLVDLRTRFGLDAFWAAVAAPPAPPASPALTSESELRDLLGRVHEAWGRWEANPGDLRDVLRTYAALYMRLESWPEEASRDLAKGILNAIEWCAKHVQEPDPAVNAEVVGGLVLLQDALEHPQDSKAQDRARQQQRRLRAVMTPGRTEYQQLPLPRWDEDRLAREARAARKRAIEQMVKDLGTTEEALDDILREEVDPKEHRQILSKLMPNLEVAAAALKMLRLDSHARLYDALVDRLDRLAGKPVLLGDEGERAVLAQAIPALVGSLQDQALGPIPQDEDELWAQAARALLNETPEGSRQAPEWETAAPVEEALEETHPVTTREGAPSGPVVFNEPEPDLLTPVQDESQSDTGPESVVEAELAPLPVLTPKERLLSPEGYEEAVDLTRVDPDILEGFFEEVPTVLDNLDGWRRTLLDQPGDEEAWEEVRRSFHTIKGSGRFIYLAGYTEVAQWFEHFVAQQRDRDSYTKPVDAVVGEGEHWLRVAFESLRDHHHAHLDGRAVWASLERARATSSAAPEEEPNPAAEVASLANDPEWKAAVFKELGRRREELTRALNGPSWDALESVAHSLRSLAKSLGLDRWSEECRFVEQAHGRVTDHEALVDRWLLVIDDIEAEQPDPEAMLDDSWAPVQLGDLTDPSLAPAIEDALEHEAPAVSTESDDLNLTLETLSFPTLEPDPADPVAEVEVEIEADHPTHPDGAVEGPAAPSSLQDPIASDRDALWDEVFAAFDMMMEGGRQLGQALARLAQEEKGDS